MSEAQAAPKLPKWPFYLADLVLSVIAGYVLYRLGAIQGTAEIVVSVSCVLAAGWGAWLSITPWLVEYRTNSALAESGNLKSSLDQIQGLEKVADLIRQSNSQWQAAQDASRHSVNAAREISEKMKIETDEFMKFIENARDQERAGLRLEVDKLRKMEGDWIKVTVQMLDHIYAIVRAAERSGQQSLINQLTQFQNACRDAARRMGLSPFVPAAGEKFDPRGHQLPDPQSNPPEEATIGEILATGYTYQGQLLRRALVLLSRPEQPQAPAMPQLEEPIRNEPVSETDLASRSVEPTEESQGSAEEGATESPASLTTEPREASADVTKRASKHEPDDQDELPLV